MKWLVKVLTIIVEMLFLFDPLTAFAKHLDKNKDRL